MPSTSKRMAAVITAAVTATVGAFLAVAAAPAMAATTAGVWLTTADRANLLRQQGNVTFGTGGSGPVITVNPNTTYQSMVGFGASLTDAAAWNIWISPRRDEIMNALFTGSGTADGIAIQLWDCAGAANQQWTATAGGDLVNTGSGKCLDVKDRSTADGAKLQIWTCTGASNQKWSVPA
jgi:hypothetical protein